MAIAYTNHIGHAARDKYTGKSTDISTISDLAAAEKHNNHDYTPEAVARMQSCIDLDLKNLNKQYVIQNGELVEVEGHLCLQKNVRKIYEEQFSAAVQQYNEKQLEAGHPERQIQSYIEHVSENKQQEVAVEGLIQFGCLEDWENRTLEDRKKVVPLLEKCLLDTLEELKGTDSEFILAGASLHMNEGTPHIHYVGVPVEQTPYAQKGMVKRVRKSAVFTKKSLGQGLQDNVRAKIEPKLKEVFGWEFEKKRAGRNEDLEKRVYVNEKLKEEIVQLENTKYAVMNELDSIIENSAETLNEVVAQSVDRAIENSSGAFENIKFYLLTCSDEEWDEMDEKGYQAKKETMRESLDVQPMQDSLDALINTIAQNKKQLSWDERQEFWGKYREVTGGFWEELPNLQKSLKSEISKEYENRYAALRSFYDAQYLLRSTRNVFVMIYAAIKAFMSLDDKRAAETKIEALKKERQYLIDNTATFKKYSNYIRTELKAGNKPCEKYLNIMTGILKYVDEKQNERPDPVRKKENMLASKNAERN